MFREEEKKVDPLVTTTMNDLEESMMRSPEWSELEAAAMYGGLDETELLKRYIELCPFVDVHGPTVIAALEGLEKRSRREHQNPGHPAVTGMEHSNGASNTSPSPPEEDDNDKVKKVENDDGPVNDRESKAMAKESSSRRSKCFAIAGTLARIIFLDFLLVFLLFVHYGFIWAEYVHNEYLNPQLAAMLFNGVDTPRVYNEPTYYLRKCDATDLSTHDGKDLFLRLNATVEEAYNHQLLHGFTVFPNVLSEDTIRDLRAHIIARNGKLTARESIYVIENENRYSYGLSTMEPCVNKAMMEIANHQLLRPSLEKILGRNPALIEMTAITSSHGAVDQYYHDDVIPEGSAIRYSRTFGPSYSVFIVLQNTTKKMGATGACPGTHYCNDGPIDEMCEKEGFQMVGEDGHWRAGDALLMNMNSFHRGSAHTDPNAPDRVMLILTFSPRPNDRVESRMMSQGITFSLRWDMWGHTLNDLAHANKIMVHPWALLRALGLYKLPGTEWGVDYITGSSQRMANNDYGFRDDELDEYIESGGLPNLPKFLQGVKEEESDSWNEYLQDTWYKCTDFANIVFWSAVGIYCVIFFPMGLFKEQRRAARRAFVRLGLAWAVVFYLYNLARDHVDQSDWAADIKAERRFANFFGNDTAFGIDRPGPTTLPNRRDVLIETRFGSEYLHMYEDYINGHPGNRYFNDLTRKGAETYASYPDFLKDASARYIASAVELNQGRFLYQGPAGRWHWVGPKRSEVFIKRQLAGQSNPYIGMLTKNIRRIQSDYMYGALRQTILAQKHSVPYLRALDEKILDVPSAVRQKMKVTQTKSNRSLFKSLSYLPAVPLRAESIRYKPRSSLPSEYLEEAEPGDWITAGDTIEHLNDGFWYVGKLMRIDALGYAKVSYSTGDIIEDTTIHYIRNYEGYEEGEKNVEVLGDDEFYYKCSIVSQNDDGTFDISGDDFEGVIHDVTKHEFRRKKEEGDGEVAERKAAY